MSIESFCLYLLHTVENSSLLGYVLEYLCNIIEGYHSLGYSREHISNRYGFSFKLRKHLCEFIEHRDASLRKLTKFSTTKVTCCTNLAVGEDKSIHINSKTSRHICKHLCCVIEFACLNPICSKLFGISNQLLYSKRGLNCKGNRLVPYLICFVRIPYYCLQSPVLEFKLFPYLYYFIGISLHHSDAEDCLEFRAYYFRNIYKLLGLSCKFAILLLCLLEFLRKHPEVIFSLLCADILLFHSGLKVIHSLLELFQGFCLLRILHSTSRCPIIILLQFLLVFLSPGYRLDILFLSFYLFIQCRYRLCILRVCIVKFIPRNLEVLNSLFCLSDIFSVL